MTTSSNFIDLLTREKKLTNKALMTLLDEKISEANSADNNFGTMLRIMAEQVMRGGKRMRPLLVRLGYRLGGGKVDSEVVKASLFPELIHQYLLMHDDLVDRDLMRYGGDTLEVVFGKWFGEKYGQQHELRAHFGRSMAMLAGDHLRTLGYQALHKTNLDDNCKIEAMELMEEVLTDTLIGWQIQYQLNFEEIASQQEARFMRGLELVTSRYSFEAPLMVGVILAGKSDELKESVRDYSRHVGIAFQVMDDILGVFGESEKTGKPVGNDIREGKKTLLILRAYQQVGSKDQNFLKRAVGKDISKTELIKVQQIIRESGALDENRRLAQEQIETAINNLKTLKVDAPEAMMILEQLARFVVERNY